VFRCGDATLRANIRAVRYRLGDTQFDGEARRLTRDGLDVHLSPKAFELLKLLIDARPRALSKHELHEHLWPSTFVSDVNLASLIAEVRAALGDSARNSTFVRTAQRFGYAFCGEASPVEAAPPAAALPDEWFCWLIHEGQRRPLQAGDNILGREAPGVIGLDSPTVSRRHARIHVDSRGAVIEDLGSKNGTFLGGAPVAGTVRLQDRDLVRLGSVELTFRVSAGGGSTASWNASRRERRGPVENQGDP
jgi:DNA-binding winged helix-turn-helix (wHTH) protein